MRLVVQRVARASVTVEGEPVARIGPGLLLLVGLTSSDADLDWARVARKVTTLRIFPDASGKMNASLADVGGSILAVSQFTLYGDVRRGRRPSFTEAAPPNVAASLFDRFVLVLRATGIPVETGVFGASMEVDLVNQGPVTLVLDFNAGAERLEPPSA